MSFLKIWEGVKNDFVDFEKSIVWLDLGVGENMFCCGKIHLISANTSNFKTFFSVQAAIVFLLKKQLNACIHVDFDGSADEFKSKGQYETGIKPLLLANRWFRVDELSLSRCDEPKDVMSLLNKHIDNQDDLSGVLFIFDVLSTMILDTNSTHDVNEFMLKMRKLANLNATIIINHHNNKGGEIYSGNTNIINKVDCAYQLHSKMIDQKADEYFLYFSCIKRKYKFLHGKPGICWHLNINADELEKLQMGVYKSQEQLENEQKQINKLVDSKNVEISKQITDILLKEKDNGKNELKIKEISRFCSQSEAKIREILRLFNGNEWIFKESGNGKAGLVSLNLTDQELFFEAEYDESGIASYIPS